jgi:hypothetical protein
MGGHPIITAQAGIYYEEAHGLWSASRKAMTSLPKRRSAAGCRAREPSDNATGPTDKRLQASGRAASPASYVLVLRIRLGA